MSRLCEEFKIVPLQQPEDAGAGAETFDSFCMKNYSHATLILLFGDNTADNILTIYEGATDGDLAAAITFSYRATAAICKAANADVLGTETTSAALTITAATYEDMMLVVEIDAAELTDGYDWITAKLDGSATEQFIAAVAVLYPKYQGAALHTALA
jgi:hypothetical protein